MMHEEKTIAVVLMEAESFEEAMAWAVKQYDENFVAATEMPLTIHIERVAYDMSGEDGTVESKHVHWNVNIGGQITSVETTSERS